MLRSIFGSKGERKGKKVEETCEGSGLHKFHSSPHGIMAIKSGRITYVEHVARMRVKKFL
jgi:hypothetical protein